VLGPNDFTHHNGGLTLVQTGQETIKGPQTVNLGQVAAVVDDNPCHATLNKIFDDAIVQSSPADILLNFIDEYCIDAASDYLPSKIPNTALSVFSSLFSQLVTRSGPLTVLIFAVLGLGDSQLNKIILYR